MRKYGEGETSYSYEDGLNDNLFRFARINIEPEFEKSFTLRLIHFFKIPPRESSVIDKNIYTTICL